MTLTFNRKAARPGLLDTEWKITEHATNAVKVKIEAKTEHFQARYKNNINNLAELQKRVNTAAAKPVTIRTYNSRIYQQISIAGYQYISILLQ
jgi:hypothetical protein